MKWKMRKIDLLEYRRAKIFCTDGSVHVGSGECVCDASEGNGADLEGILFRNDDGTLQIFTEADIEKFELLDKTA